MTGVLVAVGSLAILAVIAVAVWMAARVPDPKHIMMLDMLSRMEGTPEDSVPRSNGAAGT